MHIILNRTLVAFAISACCVLLSCGETTSGASPSASRDYANNTVSMADSPAIEYYGPEYENSLADMLPNVRYTFPDGSTSSVTDLVVRGTIASVDKLDGFVAEGDVDRGERVDFDDPAALWKTTLVTLTLEETIAGPETTEVSLSIGLDGGVDFDRLHEGLLAQPESVYFLTEDASESERGQFRLTRSQSLLVNIAPDGTLSLPLIDDPDVRRQLLGSTTTIDALVEAAEEPERTVTFEDPDYE